MKEANRTENSDSNEEIRDLLRTWPIERLRFDRAGRLKEDKKRRQRKPLDVDLDKTIARLFHGIEELKAGRAVSQGSLDRAWQLAETWHPEFRNSGNLLLILLAGLVVAQQREIERLATRGHRLDFLSEPQKLTPKQQNDLQRRDVPVVGGIEWEFWRCPPAWCEGDERQLQTPSAAYLS